MIAEAFFLHGTGGAIGIFRDPEKESAMLKKTIVSAALGTLVTGAVMAQDLPAIAEINSTTDLSAIQNREAAAFWSNLDADLQGAIAARLVDRLGDEGLSIDIAIDEVELSNAFEAELGLDLSLLSGAVTVTDTETNSIERSFEVTATARQIMPMLPENANIVVLTADTPDFYQTLVDAFADGVVDNIDG